MARSRNVSLGLVLFGAILPTLLSSRTAADDAGLHVAIPGTGYEAAVGKSQLDPSGVPKRALTIALADWLSREFDLPPAARLPAVKLVSARAMTVVRYRALSGDKSPSLFSGSIPADIGHEFVALYDDRERTIYLPDGWTGAAPRGISILVHEMVHHLQNAAGISYACPAEREKLAYRAQARFLGLFGRSLESEFAVDPMTLLVRTTCAM